MTHTDEERSLRYSPTLVLSAPRLLRALCGSFLPSFPLCSLCLCGESFLPFGLTRGGIVPRRAIPFARDGECLRDTAAPGLPDSVPALPGRRPELHFAA